MDKNYRYDFSGRLTAVTDMGQCNPDRLHFADAGVSGRILAEYVYSASGNPVVKKIGGNITSTYAYDELLNIKALKTETEKQRNRYLLTTTISMMETATRSAGKDWKEPPDMRMMEETG